MSITQITCPVCLTALSETDSVCPDPSCHFQLPQNYYQNCQEAPPLPIAAVGYSGHGKTHLLATIVLTLNELPRRTNKPITFEVLDDRTRKMMEEWSKHERSQETLGETAESTEKPEPMILRVSGFFPDRTLLVYDVAGQVFHNLVPGREHLRILRDIHTVWFVISPHDLATGVQEGGEADKRNVPTNLGYLFSSYKTTMTDLKAGLQGRHAVMVITKGDKLTGDNAKSLYQYLDNDPFRPDEAQWPDFSIQSYEQELRLTSAHLENHLGGMGDVRAMVNLLKGQQMEVSFCVTSALGQDPSPGYTTQKTATPWLRQRVLDPLIWTLLLEKNRAAAQAHVIIDPGIGTSAGYPTCAEGPIPAQLWKFFPRHQHVNAWFLGQAAPAASPGQPPPATPQRLPRLRLIGALLEPLAQVAHPEGRIVLITNNIVTDLEDFKTGAWSSRLLLITSSDNPSVREQWPNTKVIHSRDDLNDVLDFLNQ